MNARTMFMLLAGTFAANSTQAAVLEHVWSRGFGPHVGYQEAEAMVGDGLGNIYVVGRFENSVNFGGGPRTSAGLEDVFIAKYDMNGAHLWSKRFGNSNIQSGRGIALTSDGGLVVTGYFRGTVDFGGGPLTSISIADDIFLAKFDVDGNHVWSRRFGGSSDDNGYKIVANPDGSLVLLAYGFGSIDFGGGVLVGQGFRHFLVKLNPSGIHIWSKQIGLGSEVYLTRHVVDGNGNIVITGALHDPFDFGGGTLTPNVASDMVLVSYDANGIHRWSHIYGDSNPFGQYGNAVAVDDQNNVFVSGSFHGGIDFGGGAFTSFGEDDAYLAKFTEGGAHVWSRQYGSPVAQAGHFLTMRDGGHVALLGFFRGTVDFGTGPLTALASQCANSDMFLIDVDPAGVTRWSARLGGVSRERPTGVIDDPQGVLIAVGQYTQTLNLGGDTFTSPNCEDFDLFLAAFRDEQPVPTLITDFRATTMGASVEVAWEIQSDAAVGWYRLYRSFPERVGSSLIASGPAIAGVQEYVDRSVVPGGSYAYELIVTTADGADLHSPIATVSVPTIQTILEQNHPNPFNPTTTISYAIGARMVVAIEIFDAVGSRVARLDQGMREAGTYEVEWNGRDDRGLSLGSGVYFYRLEGAPGVSPRKMLLLK